MQGERERVLEIIKSEKKITVEENSVMLSVQKIRYLLGYLVKSRTEKHHPHPFQAQENSC